MIYIFKYCFKYDAISPYSIVYDTDELLFDENNNFDLYSFNKRYIEKLININCLTQRQHTCLSGGILGMSNNAISQISGWDERFCGRGWEDYAMTAKINIFIQNAHVYDTIAIHLWHPNMDLICDKENNRNLNIEYSNYTLENYIENIINTQFQIGCKNKYAKYQNICKHCIPHKKKPMTETELSHKGVNKFNKTYDIVSKYHKQRTLYYLYNTLCEQHKCNLDEDTCNNESCDDFTS